MMYPYTLRGPVRERGAVLYLYNPMAEAVLLIQRCFWTGTTADPRGHRGDHMPADLWSRGVAMLALSVVLLIVAQLTFTSTRTASRSGSDGQLHRGRPRDQVLHDAATTER